MAGGLVACGGGGATSASTAAPSAQATTATATTASVPTTTAAAPATTASAPARSTPAPSTTPSTSTSESSSGPSASFRQSGGDNSIPDYGREAPDPERQRAEVALATFLRARAKGEWSLVCTGLASTTRRQLEGFARGSKSGAAGSAAGATRSCAKVLAALSRGPASIRADTLTGGLAVLRVQGAIAFALWHGPGGSKYVMPMRNEGGAWKATEFAPLPYPLGAPASAPAK
jgi:hypothetical protein